MTSTPVPSAQRPRPIPTYRSLAARIVAAAAGAALAVVLTELLHTLIPQLTWLLVLAAVSLGAWLGGLVPGLAAAVVGALGIMYGRLEPLGSLRVARDEDLLWLASFALVALVINGVTDALHRQRTSATADADRYRDLATQLQLHASGLEREVAERRATEMALRESEQRFRLLVDGVVDYAIYGVDADGRVSSWNAGAQRILGFSAEEVVGKPLDQLFTPEDVAAGAPAAQLALAARDGHVEVEGWRVRRDGTRFWADVVTTALRDDDGRLLGYSKITRDLTERRVAHDRLLGAAAAAEAASRAKSDFLATMSHEIRTPINAILGFNELLELGIGGPLTTEQREYLARVRAGGRHLLVIVDELLDLSKIEAGAVSVRRRPAQLAPVVDAAVALVRPQAAESGLTLAVSCDEALEFVGDEDRVRQILINLLANAVKFTPAGGRVAVTCARAAAGTLEVRVTDTGVGIAAEKLETIFEPFVQVDASYTRAHGGAGLGLSISRHLARLMDGDVVAESRPGEGSTFTLRLVAAGERPREALVAEAPPSLADVGELVTAGTISTVVTAVIARLRTDPEVPSARTAATIDLEDHLGTILRELGRMLVYADADDALAVTDDAVGPGPRAGAGSAGLVAGERAAGAARLAAHLADGSAIQRLIAERHGAQRARLGWSVAELRRELTIIEEELERALRRVAPRHSNAATDRALAMLRAMLERAATISEAAHRTVGGTAGDASAGDASAGGSSAGTASAGSASDVGR